jgi:hypothetical protein
MGGAAAVTLVSVVELVSMVAPTIKKMLGENVENTS